MEGRSALLILLVLWIELSEASHRGTGEAIETRKRIVVRTLVAITLLSLNSAWVVATLSAVAIDALTLFHFGFSVVVWSLLFHEGGESVNGVLFILQLVT